jgi:hypothetical protein
MGYFPICFCKSNVGQPVIFRILVAKFCNMTGKIVAYLYSWCIFIHIITYAPKITKRRNALIKKEFIVASNNWILYADI